MVAGCTTSSTRHWNREGPVHETLGEEPLLSDTNSTHELSLQGKGKGAHKGDTREEGTQQTQDKQRLEGIVARFEPFNNSLAETLKLSSWTKLMDLLSRRKGEIRKCILEGAEGTVAFLEGKEVNQLPGHSQDNAEHLSQCKQLEELLVLCIKTPMTPATHCRDIYIV